MSIANATLPPPALAPAIARKLNRVRLWSVAIGLAVAALAGFGVLLLGAAAAMLIDWRLTPGGDSVRPWLTVAACGVAIATAVVWALRCLGRDRLLWRAAELADRSHPDMDERWTSLTRLHASSPHEVHPAMHRKLSSESVARAPQVEPLRAAPRRRFAPAVWLVGAGLSALISLFIADAGRAAVLLRRFAAPLADITLTQITNVPANMVAAKGEALTITANVAGRQPEKALLEIRGADDELKSLRLAVDGESAGEVAHLLREVDEPFAFRWTAGDARTDWVDVAIVERPRIAAMRLRIEPPTYTGRPVVQRDELPRRVRVLEGSFLEVALKAAAEVESCDLLVERGDAQEPIAMTGPDDDGWYLWREQAGTATMLQPRLIGDAGLENLRAPKCRIEVLTDRAPAVEVISPTDSVAVAPDDQIDIHFVAKDDYAVTRAELVVTSADGNPDAEPTVLETIPIDLAEQQGAAEIRASVPLDLSKFELENGQSLSYSVRVYDNRTSLGSAPPSPDVSQIAATPPGPGSQAQPTPQPTASPSDVASRDTPAGGSPTPDARSMAAAPTGAATTSPSEPSDAAAPSTTPSDSQTAGANPMAGGEPDENTDAPSSTQLADASTAEPGAAGEPLADSSTADPDAASTEAGSPSDSTPGASALAQSAASNDGSPDNDEPSATGQPSAESMAASPANATPGDPEDGSDPANSEAQPSADSVASSAPSPGGQPPGDQPASDQSSAGQPSAGQTAAGPPPNQPMPSDGAPQPPSTETSGSSKEQRLIAGAPAAEPPMPEPNTPGAANPGGPTSEQMAQQNSQSPSATAGGPTSPSSPTPSQSGEQQAASPPNGQSGPTGDVVAPEGMVAQQPNPNEQSNDEQQTASAGPSAPRPGDQMTRRLSDLAQSSSSQSMQITVDEWAGSFEGQRRDKVAIAIQPVLQEIDDNLAEAQKLTGAIADGLEAGEPWRADWRRGVDRSDQLAAACEKAVKSLNAKTRETPYAFVGLELHSIITTHMPPAREALWEARDARSDRAAETRLAWGEFSSARTRLQSLTQTFQRIRREHRLAEAAQRAKKMHQVFVENSLALLEPNRDTINNYERRLAELELDDEYLARLKEVLEMRQEMQAELARLLTDDPRLMRRYLDRLTRQNDTLRDQMTLLAERQKDIARETNAWEEAEAADRPALLQAIMQQRRVRLTEIAELAALHNERLEAWAPLDVALDDPAIARVSKLASDVAAKAQRLATMAVDDNGRGEQGQALYNQLNDLDAALRGVDTASASVALANHLLNRMGEVRRMTMLTSSWIRQAELLDRGEYLQEVAIEQYKLAMETDSLAGKLANLESELVGPLPVGSSARGEISEKTQQLLRTLDTEVSANQLAATFAMRRGREPDAAAKAKAADAAMQKVEQLFDEVMRAAIDELDKLPVQDPIAQLLQDPSLDELLALLEQEVDLAEAIGIPQRPSNLRIISDWIRQGRGGQMSGARLMAQLRRNNEEARQRAEAAYRAAIARALKEKASVKPKKRQRAVADARRTEWNTLLSELRDDLLQGAGRQPPEEYRRAIEYYLTRISRMETAESPEMMD